MQRRLWSTIFRSRYDRGILISSRRVTNTTRRASWLVCKRGTAVCPLCLCVCSLWIAPLGLCSSRQRALIVVRIAHLCVAENARYHALGMKTTTYFNPMVSPEYISDNYTYEYGGLRFSMHCSFVCSFTLLPVSVQSSPYCFWGALFDFALRRSWLASQGLFVMDHTGNTPFKFQYMNFKGCSQLDFTVPAAVAWFQDRLAKSVKLGYDGMMYDFGGACCCLVSEREKIDSAIEYTPLDSVQHDGRVGFDMHNSFTDLMYQKTAFDYFTSLPRVFGSAAYASDYVYFHRSGYTHSGRYAWAHWTGDASADWNALSGLPAQISGCLSSGLSGVAFCGSDVGGCVILLCWAPLVCCLVWLVLRGWILRIVCSSFVIADLSSSSLLQLRVPAVPGGVSGAVAALARVRQRGRHHA